jgi:glycosyltransferase involved in cell wall biosynthesis
MTMTDGILGGAEDLARQVSQRLDPGRFESTLVATRWEPNERTQPVIAELAEAGTDFIGMERGSRFDLRPWRRLVGEMRDRKIDLLHTHKIGSNLWGALLTPRVPVPIFVAHEHTWSWQGQPHRRLIDRHLIARRAAAFIAVSRADQRRMTEVEGIPPEKTRFIPVGIPDPKRTKGDEEARAELGIEPGQPVVGLVGTLRRQKAYEVMIEASEILRREFPRVRVFIAGAEEYEGATERPRLEELIKGRDLEGTVTLLGFRTDAFDLMSAFDVAAQTSDFEGSPQSVLEFMEAGKPVVATAVGGVTDQVHDGETGFLVKTRDPDAVAEAIARLLRDPELAAEMGRAGRELRHREFSMESMITKTESRYEELFEAATAAGRVADR